MVVLLGIVMLPAVGESPMEAQQKVITAMEASIEQQRESVRRQVGVAGADPSGFFVLKWPGPTAAPPAAAPTDCKPIPPAHLQAYIDGVARRQGLTPDLLRAVINKESAFVPCAVSSKGAQGLMQLMPATSAALGVKDPFDPKENIEAGARYLGSLLARYRGDVALALGAYNAGPARVDTYQGLPSLPETINYVADIMNKLPEAPKVAVPKRADK